MSVFTMIIVSPKIYWRCSCCSSR